MLILVNWHCPFAAAAGLSALTDEAIAIGDFLVFLAKKANAYAVAIDPLQRTAAVDQTCRGKQEKEFIQVQTFDRSADRQGR